MDCPKLFGKDPKNPEICYELQLPTFFKFEKIVLSEDKMKINAGLEKVIERFLVTGLSLDHCRDPTDRELFWQHTEYVNFKLASCPLPRNQGPIIPGVDNSVSDPNGEKLLEKIAWRHSCNQRCAKWFPTEKNYSQVFPEFIVEPLEIGSNEVKGPHSQLSDMGIVYTCNQMKCSLLCPCKICTNKLDNCRRKCSDFPCLSCTEQCSQHKIDIDRKYDVTKHAYTLKVDTKDKIKFTVLHAGIPKQCVECENDLTDHRVYHKVFHTRCKYCRQLLVPLVSEKILTIKDYVTAKEAKLAKSRYTCETCHKLFYDYFSRTRHEELVHGWRNGRNIKYKCDECTMKFSNSGNLMYHKLSQHNKDQSEVTCKVCDKTFKNHVTLSKHNLNTHVQPKQHSCDQCDAKFSLKWSLLRHKKDLHWDFKVDWKYIQFAEELRHQCDICEKLFKRKDNLTVHKQTVHKSENNQNVPKFICEFCSKEFANKFNCSRHQKRCKARTNIKEDQEIKDKMN